MPPLIVYNAKKNRPLRCYPETEEDALMLLLGQDIILQESDSRVRDKAAVRKKKFSATWNSLLEENGAGLLHAVR